MNAAKSETIDERSVPLTLTRYDIDRICHFSHWIPWKNGLQQKFIDENYPGWSWNQMIGLLNQTEVLIERPGGRRCHWKLKTLHISEAFEIAISWDDAVSEDDGRFYHAGENTDFDMPSVGEMMKEAFEGLDIGGDGQGSISIPGSEIIKYLEESE